LLAELNRTLLVKHKVDPDEETSGMDSLKELLNDSPKAKNRGHFKPRANGSTGPSSLTADLTDDATSLY